MGSDFDGSVVFIAGATGQAGAATAEAFAIEGASLGLIGLDAAALATVADRLRRHGVRVETVVADPSKPTSRSVAIGVLLDIFSRVDVVIVRKEPVIQHPPPSQIGPGLPEASASGRAPVPSRAARQVHRGRPTPGGGDPLG